MDWFVQLLLAIAAVLAVDFLSGLLHWAEDTFGTEKTPVIGRWIVAPNVQHHRDASAFVAKGWWASSWDLALASLLIFGLGWWFLGFSWPLALACLVGANANQIHKWNHLGPARVGPHVRFFWRTGLLQRPAHHGGHHSGHKNTRYCVVTPFVNPALDSIGFWRGLERLLVPLFGAPRREDLVRR